jgi:hypothetical protein
MFPVISWVSPKLSFLAEVVRGHTGHHVRGSVFLQLEFRLVAPDVCRIICNIDRNVADDLDPFFVRVSFKLEPLTKENVLPEFFVEDRIVVL